MENKRSIPTGTKDENGIYHPSKVETRSPDVPNAPRGTLDSILQQQLAGLERLTSIIVRAITAGDITKDTAQQLATMVKITMDLKAKENELLDSMSNEELEKLRDHF